MKKLCAVLSHPFSLIKPLRYLLVTSLSLICCLANADSGRVEWEGWKFDYADDNGATALELKAVSYNDIQILGKASFPVMRVEYRNDVCGPYADILWSNTYLPINAGQPVGACDNKKLCLRTFEQQNEKYLEIGVNAKLGEYEIYQSYIFHPSGYFDAYVFSRGLQCVVDHTHHAHWLFDFDIAGPENDQIFRNTGDLQTSEFNDRRSDTNYWSVQDAETGTRVEIIPGPEDGFPDDFSQWDVAVRAWKSDETGNWRWGPRGELGDMFHESEDINRKDLVFWYITHLDHSALEGPDTWHYSGPRIRVIPNTSQ